MAQDDVPGLRTWPYIVFLSLGVSLRVVDDPTIDTTSRTGKLVMGVLALIAEFENDIRRERQMDGIAKARDRGVKFGRKPLLVSETVKEIRKLRKSGKTVPEIMRQTSLSKASVYRALAGSPARGSWWKTTPPAHRIATNADGLWWL
jgi:DNA invertase Pin-like site-specific DNA recombinase